MTRTRNRNGKVTAWLLIAALCAPLLAGCGATTNHASLPPIDDSAGYNRPMGAPLPPASMTTRQKLVMLTGAAALYYLYKKHNSQPTTTAENQYYLSKNGRVYYRDASGQAHWVTPPKNGIQVPETEARDYRSFQGYESSNTGRDLTNLPEARL